MFLLQIDKNIQDLDAILRYGKKYAITHNRIFVCSIAIEKDTVAIATAVQWGIHQFALTGKNRVPSHLYQQKRRYAQRY